MPSRKRGELILFSADDPEPLVNFLVERHGLQEVLRLLSGQRPRGTRTASTSPKKGGAKKGGKKRGRPKGSKNGSKKGGKRSRKATGPGGAGETGNG